MNDDALVDRLKDAINSGDPDRIAACFTDDYRCEMPLHPARSFVGSAQVHRNYTQILAATPDLRAEVLRTARSGDEIWSEWEMRGTGPGGAPVLIGGVVVVGGEDRIAWARFYLDPVDDSPAPIVPPSLTGPAEPART